MIESRSYVSLSSSDARVSLIRWMPNMLSPSSGFTSAFPSSKSILHSVFADARLSITFVRYLSVLSASEDIELIVSKNGVNMRDIPSTEGKRISAFSKGRRPPI